MRMRFIGSSRDGAGRCRCEFRRQVSGVNACPCFDYWDDLRGCQVGEGKVVSAGEGKDVAFSNDGLGAKEEVGETLLHGLLACLRVWFLDGCTHFHLGPVDGIPLALL